MSNVACLSVTTCIVNMHGEVSLIVACIFQSFFMNSFALYDWIVYFSGIYAVLKQEF